PDNRGSKIWRVAKDGTAKVVDQGGIRYSNGVTLSPDQTLLYVADHQSHWVYSYQIQPDGSLKHKQKYYHLHAPDSADDAGADGMRTDNAGRLYVATRMGVQVCDQAGRVNCIIPTPNGKCANLCFGGPDFTTLIATCGDKVYSRKVKIRGANGWDAPNKPPTPRL
ncbi:MAG TPA: SMP-30/gluconolactonase/LRE family protein, partial [Planctomycetia bacterium]|nr:SMP-30/gluconolactonase/LRE family protein [Planctomycetia bacterium]